MTVRLHADGSTGTVAIYTYNTADDLPFTDPYNHIDRLLFHSGLNAISVINVVTGSLTLNAIGANSAGRNNYTLFAHGISGTPYVEGRLTAIGGSSVSRPLAGSVPVATQTQGYARLVHLGADATYVYLNEVYASEMSTSYSSLALSYEIYITDLSL